MPDERPMYNVSIEETFDVIKRAHIATGHGGRDRMVKHLAEKYANITKDALKLFKSYCEACQENIKRPVATSVVVLPIISNEFNSRGQVDLVDMQSKPCRSHKWIMVYQCHLTNILFLLLFICNA
ncbi:hypothetical protein Pmani_016349 [Petrolisthes manimaculis]|uniref:Integrase zinc-binding domain-containing protein n=1 Tax=Petrolisthes manimaculis TaxID=1843537 RepID=A0AAE1PPM2_9EUCA|nr:hypothetical protein Pmani_016349 [Petrolisthes manimaculis]